MIWRLNKGPVNCPVPQNVVSSLRKKNKSHLYLKICLSQNILEFSNTDFFSSLCVQTGTGAHSASCTMGTGGREVLAPELKGSRGIRLTTHPHLMPRSRMSRSYTSSAPNASVACSETALALVLLNGLIVYSLEQPSSNFLPWRNPLNNFQVSGNPCIKIIISTAHGTLACSVSCRYNNPIIIVNALLSRE
jgi:hypothetical protein